MGGHTRKTKQPVQGLGGSQVAGAVGGSKEAEAQTMRRRAGKGEGTQVLRG